MTTNSTINGKKFICSNIQEAMKIVQQLEPETTDSQVADCVEALNNAVYAEGKIRQHLEFIGKGSYKLVYELLSLEYEWIIKFCAPDNDTLEEIKCLDYAADANVLDIFIPTIFFQLSVEESTLLADKECFLKTEFIGGETQIWVQIQPMIEVAHDRGEVNWDKELVMAYRECTEFDNQYLLTVHDKLDAPIRWLDNVDTHYGRGFFERFFQFCKDANMLDLSSRNVGYNGELQPVIIDWISDLPQFLNDEDS